ncbi:MAG: hypothetical protein MR992_06620 [Lachnospiraceae bacterium]|nr:hypothetical protein [Lachnospiraceae bacterium]MDD7626962.1 hypothetical protein [Lachnospiraceae bacterium]MDY4119305.1 DUF6688 family protein [Lachnospiraceae bacterium]
MENAIGVIVSGMLILLPFLLIALDIIFAVKKKERPIFEMIAFFIGSIYMILAYTLWELPDYKTPLNAWGGDSAHEPVAAAYWPAILLIVLWGFGSYMILKFKRKLLPPLAEVFLLAGVYAGCAFNLVFLFQLLMGADPQPYMEEGIHHVFTMNAFDYLVTACLCVVPVLFLIHCVQLMVLLVKEKAAKQESIHYGNKVLEMVNLFLLKGANLFYVAVAALLPVLFLLVVILVLFGQQPDSFILAFTKTSDWILSKEIAPPPVAYDTHYLCTVSLKGHRKLVKPIRYGMRRGEKIVVNRQLCVANAFEQLLEERTPRFHRAVRNFYDTYGYPVSKHIKSAWSADITYLIMKPLEWIFLVVLYLFDEKPEDRICRQYLPEGTCGMK